MKSRDSSHRTRFEGLRKIVQFNWPFYLVGGALLIGGSVGLFLLHQRLPPTLFITGLAAISLAAWWLIASLIASHWIYDRARIYDFQWLNLPEPDTAAILTAGFDESLPGLSRKWPDTEWRLLNFYDAESMSEPSIQRAINRYPLSVEWQSCQFDQWPTGDARFDLILFPFSAHELRSPPERVALLKEAKRSLKPTGRILIIEHLRNLPNAIAFGPGFFHFHSETAWQSDFEEVGLHLQKVQRLTCFVKASLLESL